jgi:hypothetical protein
MNRQCIGIEPQSLCIKLIELKSRHQALAGDINGLQKHAYINQIQVQRLIKQKLFLKRQIQCIEDLLIPDLNA